MEFLRITAADGTRQYIPDNYVVNIATTADSVDAGSDYRAPNVVRGKITGVKYYDGANGTAGALVVASVAAFNGSNDKYEYGFYNIDGSFSAALTN
jgi:hypothetical protein